MIIWYIKEIGKVNPSYSDTYRSLSTSPKSKDRPFSGNLRTKIVRRTGSDLVHHMLGIRLKENVY